MPENIDELLAQVKKPSRYIGNEFNACAKNWDEADFRVALVFPDLYEIGMSHHGLQILYSVINDQQDLLADRVYVPDRDLEEILLSRGISIFGLESRRSLAQFDLIGITLPYELCYTNILTVLALGQIPFRSSDRDDSHPFVIGGGTGSFNPEPVADFFDAILLGDGEEAVLEITAVLKSAKKIKEDRKAALGRLANVTGVYVPSFFEPLYDSEGKLLSIKSLKKGYERVERRILPDLESFVNPDKPLVPLVKIVHDRLGIEVARGCTRGCRFCQAGIIYRPVRERSADRILELAEKGMTAGGYEELALLSLSTGDYSCLSPVLTRLMDRFVKDYISVSMPSMRVGTLTPEIMNQIRRVRKTGFTLAPEAGTDRLRQVINKGITEDDLLQTARVANVLGWKLLKFYFMFGLPTETEEDIKAIADLVRRTAQTSSSRALRINVSVAAFVPKPHTPFQWEPQISITESFAKIDLLKKYLSKGNCKLKWQDPRQSFLEGVMSRGDRLLSGLIEEAWRRGARLDGWSEHYDLTIWQDAARICNMDLENYLRRRDFSEILPWQHLDTGVEQEFLKEELEKSFTGDYTQDCRVHACQNCGVCDFKQVKPVVQCKSEVSIDKKGEEINYTDDGCMDQRLYEHEKVREKNGAAAKAKHWYRLFYAKQGDIRFLSHLEMIQVFFQGFRRAGVKLHFTKGFNPVPKASFSPALPVGTESLAEYLDIDLREPIADEQVFLDTVNRQMPAGITIQSVTDVPDKKNARPQKSLTCYEIGLTQKLLKDDRQKLQSFMELDNFVIRKKRKDRVSTIDIRQQVENFIVTGDNSIEMILYSEEGKAAGKPIEILKAALDLNEVQSMEAAICKVWSKPAPS